MSGLQHIRLADAGHHQPLQQRVLQGNRPDEPLSAAQMGLIWSREYER